jgi:hypothetical protein
VNQTCLPALLPACLKWVKVKLLVDESIMQKKITSAKNYECQTTGAILKPHYTFQA